MRIENIVPTKRATCRECYKPIVKGEQIRFSYQNGYWSMSESFHKKCILKMIEVCDSND